MSSDFDWLIDPITGRRVLPEGTTWIGNENNVESPAPIPVDKVNLRDLIARIHMLNVRLDYIRNSRLLIPFSNKYIPNAQVLSNLAPAILKQKGGIVKEAVAGEDYVDFQEMEDGKFCIINPNASTTSNKFICSTDITPQTIINITEEVTNIDNTVNNITNEITNITEEINYIDNTINNITNEFNNYAGDVHNHFENISEYINNTINNFNNVINNITNVVNNITNNNIINNVINNVQHQTDNHILELNFNFTVQLRLVFNLYLRLSATINAIIAAVIPIIGVVNTVIVNNTRISASINSQINMINNLVVQINAIANVINNFTANFNYINNRIDVIYNRFNAFVANINNYIMQNNVRISQRIALTIQGIQNHLEMHNTQLTAVFAQLTAITQAISVIQANILAILEQIEDIDTSSSGICIAWAIANDSLNIIWE